MPETSVIYEHTDVIRAGYIGSHEEIRYGVRGDWLPGEHGYIAIPEAEGFAQLAPDESASAPDMFGLREGFWYWCTDTPDVGGLR